MRCTFRCLYKTPKNTGVAPRFDIWNEKYEPWVHMRQMGKLVGTGFYIPPDWYNHFRMFPPIQHNFQQEKTLNPQNESEPTQDDTDYRSAQRIALREELARKSRLLASQGMRYYNIFWIRKPLDRMQKQYYDLKRRGVDHATALKKVLQLFYNELTLKKRVAAIQAEEAKLSGKFITMREAVVVMRVLATMQQEQLTPHQVSMLAQQQSKAARFAPLYTANVTYSNTNNNDNFMSDESQTQKNAKTSNSVENETQEQQTHASHEASSQNTVDTKNMSNTTITKDDKVNQSIAQHVQDSFSQADFSADNLANILAQSMDAVNDGKMHKIDKTQIKAEFTPTFHDSAAKLRQMATDHSGSLLWYSGASPFLDMTEDDNKSSNSDNSNSNRDM